jgi:phage shock protein E
MIIYTHFTLQAVKKEDAVPKVIIDVREPYEYTSGHVERAINLPLSSFNQVPEELKDRPKDTPIIVYCLSDNRSAQALALLNSWGYTNVTNGINQRNVEANLS